MRLGTGGASCIGAQSPGGRRSLRAQATAKLYSQAGLAAKPPPSRHLCQVQTSCHLKVSSLSLQSPHDPLTTSATKAALGISAEAGDDGTLFAGVYGEMQPFTLVLPVDSELS